MKGDPIERLVQIGFSEYEAKAYVALLRTSPVTGYQLSKLSGVPRSMIYEVAGKLGARGAAMTLRTGGGTKYAPVPAGEFLDQFQREQTDLVEALRSDLTSFASTPDLDYVWNIEGHDNIMGKATEMIHHASQTIYLALVPGMFEDLKPELETAVGRNVRVTVYTSAALDMPGAQVVIANVSVQALEQARGLGLILVVDGEEVLVAEWQTASHARASWTSTPLLVFIAEHHLRTDLYLPQILSLLGDQALELIREEDRELFARAFESSVRG